MSTIEKKNQISIADKIYDKTFKIKLKSSIANQAGTLKADFARSLEIEYATKYLESLKLEPNKHNINTFLKSNPIKFDKITAGWNNTGMLADSITIAARTRETKKSKAQENGSHLMEHGGLSKNASSDGKNPENTKIDSFANLAQIVVQSKNAKKSMSKHLLSKKKIEESRKDEDDDDEDKYPFKLDFDINSIKKKYLFPFNVDKSKDNHPKKMNYEDSTMSLLPKLDKNESQDELINTPKYFFPFEKVKLNHHQLKELQVPIKMVPTEILSETRHWCQSFPLRHIPYELDVQETEADDLPPSRGGTKATRRTGSSVPLSPACELRGLPSLKFKDISETLLLIKSEEFGRIAGIMAHLCYWQIFGNLLSIQPDFLTKKQMIVGSFDQIQALRKHCKSIKVFSNFQMPMIILALRMIVEWIFRNSYFSFFENNEAREIALDRINTYISKLLDHNNFFSRFSFLESEIEAINKKQKGHLEDARTIHKRVYATSPFMDILFPTPDSGFVRNIQFRQRQKKVESDPGRRKIAMAGGSSALLEIDEDKAENEPDKEKENHENLKKTYKVKMFQIMLEKIDDDMTKRLGKKTNIINFTKPPAAIPQT